MAGAAKGTLNGPDVVLNPEVEVLGVGPGVCGPGGLGTEVLALVATSYTSIEGLDSLKSSPGSGTYVGSLSRSSSS